MQESGGCWQREGLLTPTAPSAETLFSGTEAVQTEPCVQDSISSRDTKKGHVLLSGHDRV
jgi:hypothetical protein